mgnify:CR=1 FL=1
MDIKAMIEEVVNKVKNDKDFRTQFIKDPVKAVENVTGIDLPDEKVKEIIKVVKSNVNLEEISGKLGGIGGIIDKIKK